MAFADLFTLTRLRAALYRDSAGVLQEAAINAPRFDHLVDGTPRGLLIEGRPQFNFADYLAPKLAAWPSTPGTVLHEYETPEGEIRRRAFYAADPSTVAGGLLNAKGWHRRIGVVAGYLKNRGGYVTYLDEAYQLGGVLAVAPYVLLDASASATAAPLIEG